MTRHAEFTWASGVPVYFCDAYCPWQRSSNENTNGLLRQYFPKKTDLSLHTPSRCSTSSTSSTVDHAKHSNGRLHTRSSRPRALQ